MRVDVTDKLVSQSSGEVIGFLVSAGGQYKVAVTEAFGVAHAVADMDIAAWLEVPCLEVIPAGKKGYAIIDRSLGFMEEFADSPVEYLGDRKVYYGHLFNEQSIVPMDSEVAFDRMVKEAEGRVFE